MSLKIRFRFDGRCSVHPRYNPEKDGRPQHEDCPGCDSLWVVYLYSGIARRKAETGEGIFVVQPEIHADKTESVALDEEDPSGNGEEQTPPAEGGDPSPLT
jgi:hypothetical protein